MNIEQSLKFFTDTSNTVKELFDAGHCNYCGACILVCPKNAISYENMELNVNDDCIHCGRCLQICSQNLKMSFTSKLANKMDNSSLSKYQPRLKDLPVGSFENIYVSRSAKENVRNSSMIGGTTTSLMLYALDHSIIDAALVTDFDSSRGFPIGKLIAKKEEILASGGSKYLPTFSLEKLTEVVDANDYQSLAITTLPCQAYAIRKFGSDSKTAVLSSKIKLVLTLFCGTGVPSKEDINLFLKRKKVNGDFPSLKVRRSKEKRFWRLNPQDQERYIYTTGTNKEHNFSSRQILNLKSKNNCSLLCPDYTGYHSDVSVGAAHMNTNLTITRTELGERIFQEAVENKYIEIMKFKPMNYFLINLMGKNKRENNRLAYQESHY